MQSILQYRMFERTLREQVERHGVMKIAGFQDSTQFPIVRPPSHCDIQDNNPTVVQTLKDEADDLQRVTTQDTNSTALGRMMTGVRIVSKDATRGEGDKSGKHKHVFVVGYVDAADPLNPHNWSMFKRISATVLVS